MLISTKGVMINAEYRNEFIKTFTSRSVSLCTDNNRISPISVFRYTDVMLIRRTAKDAPSVYGETLARPHVNHTVSVSVWLMTLLLAVFANRSIPVFKNMTKSRLELFTLVLRRWCSFANFAYKKFIPTEGIATATANQDKLVVRNTQEMVKAEVTTVLPRSSLLRTSKRRAAVRIAACGWHQNVTAICPPKTNTAMPNSACMFVEIRLVELTIAAKPAARVIMMAENFLVNPVPVA